MVALDKDAAWQPTAELTYLRERARLIAKIRQFFDSNNVLEVDTPVLGRYPVTDPYLDNLTTQVNGETRYLQTSPEYAMKRLLAAGSGSIYQLGKAFRADEYGTHHLPEFTMLEWYRVGFDDFQLMAEVDRLLQSVFNWPAAERFTYSELFKSALGIDPHHASDEALRNACDDRVGKVVGLSSPSRDECLQLLFSQVIEPKLGLNEPAIVYNYPASQAALAKVVAREEGRVAARFEVYYQGVELGNGYFELTDAEEQRRRFETDLHIRQKNNRPCVQVDQNLLAALEAGLPECAGIAMGVDRLIMLALGRHAISDVVVL